MNFEIFKNKKVLITGHTGFKGSWLTLWMNDLGAKVFGISNDFPSKPCHFELLKIRENISCIKEDIRDKEKIKEQILKIKPDFIFHLAAQPLVKKSYEDPILTYETNFIGTLNILETLKELSNRCIVVLITSDKSYKNVEWTWGYRENDQFGGIDPYSASKGATEIMINSYCKSFFEKNRNISIGVGRAGNVIGGGDWALDRIVPDCYKAWSSDKEVLIRKGNATRPWQHVIEPLGGYIALACALNKNRGLHGEAFNFGPNSNQNHTVNDLISELSSYWPGSKIKDITSQEQDIYESGLLKLNCDKAFNYLGWQPILNIDETVRMTSDWYTNYFHNKTNVYNFSLLQLNQYKKLAQEKKIRWKY
jgi:CDP-glucose 4,6-dehydratase